MACRGDGGGGAADSLDDGSAKSIAVVAVVLEKRAKWMRRRRCVHVLT